MLRRIGKFTLEFENTPVITGYGSVAGKKESQGPLKDKFDKLFL